MNFWLIFTKKKMKMMGIKLQDQINQIKKIKVQKKIKKKIILKK